MLSATVLNGALELKVKIRIHSGVIVWAVFPQPSQLLISSDFDRLSGVKNISGIMQ